jgi:hypothetical protein
MHNVGVYIAVLYVWGVVSRYDTVCQTYTRSCCINDRGRMHNEGVYIAVLYVWEVVSRYDVVCQTYTPSYCINIVILVRVYRDDATSIPRMLPHALLRTVAVSMHSAVCSVHSSPQQCSTMY